MFIKKKKEILILFIAFLITSLVSKFYLNKFENYNNYQNGNHPMIKSSVSNHWGEANLIIQDLKSGKSVIKSGSYLEDEFLPPKLLAFYYFVSGQEMYYGDLIKINNGKFFYLIIKNFLYYFLLFIFFQAYKNYISKKILYTIIIYLSFLPDIIQYLPSFWNESWTIIFQILLLIFLFKINFGVRHNFTIGVLSSLLYLTGQEYIFYPIIFMFYYFFLKIYYQKNILKISISFLFGYFLILSSSYLISSFKSNSQNENFYGIKSALYLYVVPNILTEKKKISYIDAKNFMKKEASEWAKKNNLEIYNEKTESLLLKFDKEDYLGKKKYNNYIFIYSIKSLFFNIHHALIYLFKKILHMMVLNPFFVHNYYEYETVGTFLKSEKHQSNIKIRLVYSIIFYLMALYGFLRSLKIYRPEFIFLLSLLILYNIVILGFLGTPRYFAPCLIYMSFFFGPIFEKKKY